MIVIVDNGKAAENIKSMIRTPTTIAKPPKIQKAMSYILSDGQLNPQTKKANEDIVKTATGPVLGIGLGAAYILSAFGADIKKRTVKKSVDNILVFGNTSSNNFRGILLFLESIS